VQLFYKYKVKTKKYKSQYKQPKHRIIHHCYQKPITSMKSIQNSMLLTALFCLIITVSCGKDKDESAEPDYQKYKLVAWNSLSASEQAIVTHEWKEAEAILTKNPDDNADRIVLVVFHTTMDALLCPINVYVDLESQEVIYPENIMLCD
jgi:hypothetical protein